MIEAVENTTSVEVVNQYGVKSVRLRSPSGVFIKERKPRSKTFFVYLIGSADGAWQKIGYSKDVQKRMTDFNVPFELVLICSVPTHNPMRLEKAMHARFASKRCKGEWFQGVDREAFLNAAKRLSVTNRKYRCSECGNLYLRQDQKGGHNGDVVSS